MLALERIGKRFPGVVALHDVSLDITPGSVLALAGENGAGKSTLMKILTGIYCADTGRIVLDGLELVLDGPAAAQRAGIAIVHQELNLLPNLTVAENIYIGREPRRFGWLAASALREQAERLLRELGIDLPAAAPVSQLSIAQQQMVEIAKALSLASRYLVLDEPTSSLTEREAQVLFALIRRLRDQGLGIVYISHRMDELFALSDRVAVLRDGELVWRSATAATSREDVIAAMVGRPLAEFYRKVDAKIGDIVLTLEHLGVTLELRRGEIVGLAGLIGAGRTELARTLFGVDPAPYGAIAIDGRKRRIASPRDAIRAGLGLVPEDRKGQALFLSMAVRENITLASLRHFSALGWISGKRERAGAQSLVDSLRIRTAGMEQSVVNLSGGNQQKVVLARWLALHPKILILDEPTRGVDVGAKAEIHGLIGALASGGAAILLISSELPEVLSLADRVLVMARRRIVANLGRAEVSPERVMAAATSEPVPA